MKIDVLDFQYFVEFCDHVFYWLLLTCSLLDWSYLLNS